MRADQCVCLGQERDSEQRPLMLSTLLVCTGHAPLAPPSMKETLGGAPLLANEDKLLAP